MYCHAGPLQRYTPRDNTNMKYIVPKTNRFSADTRITTIYRLHAERRWWGRWQWRRCARRTPTRQSVGRPGPPPPPTSVRLPQAKLLRHPDRVDGLMIQVVYYYVPAEVGTAEVTHRASPHTHSDVNIHIILNMPISRTGTKLLSWRDSTNIFPVSLRNSDKPRQ